MSKRDTLSDGRRSLRRFVVAKADAIPPSTQQQVRVAGRAIAIFNVNGRYFALRDACPHQGAALSRGRVVSHIEAELPGRYCFDPEKKRVICPWHGWEYDLQTGQSWYDPAHNRVRAYDVDVEDGESLRHESDSNARVSGSREGPYIAGTVDVAREGDYVVVYL